MFSDININVHITVSEGVSFVVKAIFSILSVHVLGLTVCRKPPVKGVVNRRQELENIHEIVLPFIRNDDKLAMVLRKWQACSSKSRIS